MKTKDNHLIKYVCTRNSKQSKKGNIGHLAMAAAGDHDVIQRVMVNKEMNKGERRTVTAG
jgi:hypothetical protein